MTVVTLVVFAAVIGRLTQVQVVSRRKETAYGTAELIHVLNTPAERGSIEAADGSLLAISVATADIIADPHQVTDPNAEAAALTHLLNLPEPELRSELSQDAGFIYLARDADTATAAAVARLSLPGITEQPDSSRGYPDGTLMASLLGSVNAAGAGSSGLEYEYNSMLSGRSGRELVEEGASGIQIPGGVIQDISAQPGRSLQITVSPAIQYFAQQELGAELTSTRASQATALVVQSRTGDILAAVSLVRGPGGKAQPAATPDALTAVYEPGSVMKLPTYAAVLGHGIAGPSTPISVPADLSIDGSIFHDAEVHPAETLTLSQCLAQSSNICTIEMAERLGKQGLDDSLHAFGFGEAQGLDFPGMSPGILSPPSRWSGTALAATAIGQDEAVDLLQIADAYDVVANGGVSVPPRLVEATIDANGIRHPVPAPKGKRIVSQRVARTLVGMLEGVVSAQGTAPAAAIPGYTVAGKTGTAQIPDPRGSGYLPGAFNATFVGFVPAQQPAITVVVRLANPNVIYGGSVAAPVAARIMSYALRILAIPSPQGTVNQGAPAEVSNSPGTAPGLPTSG